jgi:toxin CcdB
VAQVLIAQCDVFCNPGRRGQAFPFVVVLQADSVSDTNTVVVAPLAAASSVAASRLTPVFHVQGQDWALIMSNLAAVPRRQLVDRVANLLPDRDRIIAALDLLFIGF